jgi:large subunit ribosomal protein L6
MFSKEAIIPQDVQVEVTGNKVKVTGGKGSLERVFKAMKDVKIEKVEGKVVVSSESSRRLTKALVGTVASHVRNMVVGVTKGYTYKMKVIYSHFPITVKLENGKVAVHNFLGERVPRIATIYGNSKVKIDGQDITITGNDVEDVGTTASNIEQATRIRARDRKVFQDGVWLVSRE